MGVFGTGPFLGTDAVDAADASLMVVTILDVKAFRHAGTAVCSGTNLACSTSYIWNADSNLILGHR